MNDDWISDWARDNSPKDERAELSTLRTALARAEEQIKEKDRSIHAHIDNYTNIIAEKDKEIERLKAERDDLRAAFNRGFEMYRAAEAKIAELEARCAAQEKR